jgi:hypothetical protein
MAYDCRFPGKTSGKGGLALSDNSSLVADLGLPCFSYRHWCCHLHPEDPFLPYVNSVYKKQLPNLETLANLLTCFPTSPQSDMLQGHQLTHSISRIHVTVAFFN